MLILSQNSLPRTAPPHTLPPRGTKLGGPLSPSHGPIPCSSKVGGPRGCPSAAANNRNCREMLAGKARSHQNTPARPICSSPGGPGRGEQPPPGCCRGRGHPNPALRTPRVPLSTPPSSMGSIACRWRDAATGATAQDGGTRCWGHGGDTVLGLPRSRYLCPGASSAAAPGLTRFLRGCEPAGMGLVRGEVGLGSGSRSALGCHNPIPRPTYRPPRRCPLTPAVGTCDTPKPPTRALGTVPSGTQPPNPPRQRVPWDPTQRGEAGRGQWHSPGRGCGAGRLGLRWPRGAAWPRGSAGRAGAARPSEAEGGPERRSGSLDTETTTEKGKK